MIARFTAAFGLALVVTQIGPANRRCDDEDHRGHDEHKSHDDHEDDC
jgi:hypothetical protein